MNTAAWLALIQLLVESGLAEKLINLFIQIFNALSSEAQKQVADVIGKKFLEWKPTIPTA